MTADGRVMLTVLLLDPVYIARGFRALRETLGRDRRALGQRVLHPHRRALRPGSVPGAADGLDRRGGRTVRAARGCRSCPARGCGSESDRYWPAPPPFPERAGA